MKYIDHRVKFTKHVMKTQQMLEQGQASLVDRKIQQAESTLQADCN